MDQHIIAPVQEAGWKIAVDEGVPPTALSRPTDSEHRTTAVHFEQLIDSPKSQSAMSLSVEDRYRSGVDKKTQRNREPEAALLVRVRMSKNAALRGLTSYMRLRFCILRLPVV